MHKAITLRGNKPEDEMELTVFYRGEEIGTIYPQMRWATPGGDYIEPVLVGYGLISQYEGPHMPLEEAIGELLDAHIQNLREGLRRTHQHLEYNYLHEFMVNDQQLLEELIISIMGRPNSLAHAVRVYRDFKSPVDAPDYITGRPGLMDSKRAVEEIYQRYLDALVDEKNDGVPF